LHHRRLEGARPLKLFHLYRIEDLSGVSGTGPVVEGVVFTNGWCALRWMSRRSTVCFYQSIEDVRNIHGHGGKTELILHDFEPLRGTRGEAASRKFESFLETVENLSALVNLGEEPEATLEQVTALEAKIQEDLRSLKAQIAKKIRTRAARTS